MRKFTLTLLVLVATATQSMAQVAINETNFPDANFRSFLLKESYGADGVLSAAEIAAEQYMEVYDQGITDLTGIEFFTELKELDCSHNKLTSLNVSKNTKLTELYCEDNQIRGAQMDALIASLPNKAGKKYEFGVRDATKDIANDNDITMTQVAAAKAKGWVPQEYDGNDYTAYAGSDASTLGIVINSKNFPDFYFRRYLTGEYYGADGVLTPEEIAGIDDLWLTAEFIGDLTGIEYFTALKSLDVSQNGIKTLDLSKMQNLESLNCSDNSLTTLILPTNGKLTSLGCSDNEDLETLNLSACTALTSLSCSGTKLSSLDVSKCTELKSLTCSATKLTSLSLTNNLNLKTLNCDNIGLTTLDVSACTALDYLNCSKNKLTQLNLSANTKLQTLKCEENKLTALDLTNNNNMRYVYCGKNQIKGEQMNALVGSVTTEREGILYALYLNDAAEGNEITKEQIAIAEDRDWEVYAHTVNNGWMVYQGETGLPIDYVNFPDSEFRYYLTHTRYGLDGFLTDAEIASFTELKVTYNGYVESLKGIEYLTGLQIFDCYGLELTELDLSANTKLQELNCCYGKFTSLLLPDSHDLNSVICHMNQIKGAEMDALIASLPTVTEGNLYAINLTDTDEGNVITTTQVAAAKNKHWTVWALGSENWIEYEGSEPTGISSIHHSPFTIDNDAPMYNLAGQKVGKSYKGIIIRNGKKVVMK